MKIWVRETKLPILVTPETKSAIKVLLKTCQTAFPNINLCFCMNYQTVYGPP